MDPSDSLLAVLAAGGGFSPLVGDLGLCLGAAGLLALAFVTLRIPAIAALLGAGVWRGPAKTRLPSGEYHSVTQTERIGPFLDGSVKVMEGRGYDAEGKVTFNAFGTISFDPATQKHTLHSYAQGRVGDFPLTVKSDGYVWEIPAGPMTIRYTATIKDGSWNEVGDYIVPGKDPDRFFEMNLKRVGDTKWPAEGTIPQK